jgi:uncharacterized membrane protein
VGIFGLVFFFVVLYFQISLFGSSELENLKYGNSVSSFINELIHFSVRNNFFKYLFTTGFISNTLKSSTLKVYNS